MTIRKPEQAYSRSMLMSMSGLYAYIYCMLVSQLLVNMPIFGGALYMCAQVATVFHATYSAGRRAQLPPRAVHWHRALLIVLLLLNICVVVLYPTQLDSPQMWMLFALVLMMALRDAMTGRLIRLSAAGSMPERLFVTLLVLGEALQLGAMAWIYLFNLPAETAWFMLGGYALCSGAELYAQLKQRPSLAEPPEDVSEETAQETRSVLRRANAYTAYDSLSMLIMVALQMTLVVMYTYLAASATQLLVSMVLALISTLIFREAAEWLIRRREKRGRRMDPTNMMLIGLFLWLYALILFSRMLRTGTIETVNVYFCLGLCTAGATLCLTCLSSMEQTMAAVAAFAAGRSPEGYRELRAASMELATLLGKMLALAALTVLCFATGQDLPRDAAQLAARFQPLMVLPAILTVIGALLCVLRFPLSSRHMAKLSRFLRLKETGGDNPALRRQLEAVVLQRHRQPFGTRVMLALLRPFYRHTLKDADHIRQDDENPLVFLCNHGEFYGPLVCMMFIPVPIRAWSMSELVVDKHEVAAYVYKYTISPQKWLPERLKWPIANMIGPASVWVMRQLESIPVYRNKLRELIKTFRLSVEAMQAGDNLLIFPENPNAVEEGHGYERSGVGELFSGFAMLAPIYYNQTGKRCRFMPMFAHKGARTISFGTEIIYDPDADERTERDRLVAEIHQQMQALAQREEALWQQKHGKGI